MKCTKLIMQDHAMLRRALDILDGIVSRLEQGERIEIVDAMTILKFIRLFGIEYHQTMEEKVLFPALLRATAQEGRISDMLFEHEEHRSLMGAIDNSLNSRRGIEFVRRSHGLSILFRNHLDREDTLLHKAGESWLSAEEDDGVVTAFVKHRTEPDSYLNFSRLEWKYAPKPVASSASSGRGLAQAGGSA